MEKERKRRKFIHIFLIVLLFPAISAAEKLNIYNVREISNGKELFKHYCQVCHGEKGDGNGINAPNVVPPPANFTDVEQMTKRTDEKLFEIISLGGKGASLSKNMPPWGKTLSESQIWSIIKFIRTFSNTTGLITSQMTFDGAQTVSDSSNKCAACHSSKITRNIIAPDLGYERSKFDKNWLLGFLKDPIKIRPIGYMPFTKSRMPRFQFTNLEAEALAEYLLQRDDSVNETTLVSNAGSIDFSPDAADEGKKLFRKLGCGACHEIEGKGGQVGPDLSKSSHRLKPYWVYAWIKNPQAIRPDAPMPNYGLEDEEARLLVSYLMHLKEEAPFPVTVPTEISGMSREKLYSIGETLVQQKNCLGCHYMHSRDYDGFTPKSPL